MSDLFFRLYQHLLPTGRAWRIVVDKYLRRFFQGLTDPLGVAFKEFMDAIFLDLFAQETRQLEEWEDQFALTQTPGNTEQQRRDRLAAAWLGGGNLSPKSIQDTLRAAGFDVYVHEAWFFDPNKQIRDPNQYLADGTNPLIYVAECDEPIALCGQLEAECGETVGAPLGYPLVNKITETLIAGVDCGEDLAQCGENDALCGNIFGVAFVTRQYELPTDPSKYPFFWYVAGENFPDFATVEQSRRDEFETLVLKIGPTHLWAGILVNYS